MIVNCTYFLLKHGAKQRCLTFCWQTKRRVASPPPPQRHNDVILEKNSLETPPYRKIEWEAEKETYCLTCTC